MSAAGKGRSTGEPANKPATKRAKKGAPKPAPVGAAPAKPAPAKPEHAKPEHAKPEPAGTAGSPKPSEPRELPPKGPSDSNPKARKPAAKPSRNVETPAPGPPGPAEPDTGDPVQLAAALDVPAIFVPDLADPDLADPELIDPELIVGELADPDQAAALASPDMPEPALSAPVATPQRESRWSTRDRDRERVLLNLLSELPADDLRRAAARDELVRMHMPLAAFLARRFRDRGEHLDDLTQVATVGLIKAVDRFETGRGVEFSTFATPTIVGEIKRHFRDKGWAIRVPRRLQELRLAITRATAELGQSQGTSPTVGQLAAHLGLSEEEVLEGLESAAAYATVSLDSTGSGDSAEDGASIAETVGGLDPSLAEVDNRETLHPLLASLGEREQRIVYMRFFENKTQAQIAQEIGVSQMHISRLLTKSLAQMRSGLAVEP